MNTSLYIQYTIIGVLVVASVVATLRKLAPALSTRLAGQAAAVLQQPGRPGIARAVGRWLKPKQASGDCGDGCSTCGSCDTSDATDAGKATPPSGHARPLTFHARKR